MLDIAASRARTHALALRSASSLSTAPVRLALVRRDYEESQHPRDEHGRWTEGGDSGGAVGDAPSAPKIDSDKVEAKTKRNVAAASALAKANGITPLVGSKGQHPNIIATRNPTSKKGPKVSAYAQPDVASMKLDPKRYQHDIGLFKNDDFYPNFRAKDLSGSTDEVTRAVVGQMKDNIKFLYQFADKQTQVWYDGARALVDDRVKLWGFNDASVAGVYAALSPTKDWDENVHIADMLMKTYKTQQNHRWDEKMEEKSKTLWSAKNQKVVDLVRGKTLGELESPKEKALWIRTYDETHNSPNYRVVRPNGAMGPVARNDDKEHTPSKIRWQSISATANAVKALEANGDLQKISAAMGNAHKVRSFFNNILDPHSANGDVTIDTHAVGAALLRQLAPSAVPVAHNFGDSLEKADKPEGWEAVGASVITGLKGLYPVYAQAYREAAQELGIQPRQLQSAVWVVKRYSFGKATKKTQEAIESAWHDYHDRKVTLAQTRDTIADLLGLKKNERHYRLDEAGGRRGDARELHRNGMGLAASVAMDGRTGAGIAGRASGLVAFRDTGWRTGAQGLVAAKATPTLAHLRDFDESQHPRDEHGRWTDGSGGGGAAPAEAPTPAHGIKGLPADVTVKFPTLHEAIARDAFDVTAKPVGTHGDRYELTVTAKIPSHVKALEGRFGSPIYYDPKFAKLETIDAGTKWETQIPKPKAGQADEIAPLPEKDIIYRGMSDDEYQKFRETGRIESHGGYNLTGQEGLTYWTTDTRTAEAYANGFAPWSMIPTFEKPAWVVATKMPSEVKVIPGTAVNEVGVARPVTKNEIVAAWRGDAYAHRPGKMDIRREGYEGDVFVEGSRSSPSTSVVWSRRDVATELGVAFVSPNVGNLDFSGALAGLNSQRQELLRRASADVDERLGKSPIKATNVVGAWSDGAENSLMLRLPPDWTQDQARVAMAMKGWLGDQKSVLLFTPDPKGESYVASLSLKGKLDDIHRSLSESGLVFHTLEPTSEGATVYVYGDSQATADTVNKVAISHGTQANFTFGNGEFPGTKLETGSDREQRDDARRAYEAIIGSDQARVAFGGRDIPALWAEIRGRWGGEFSSSDTSLAKPAVAADDTSGVGRGDEGGRGRTPSPESASRAATETARGHAPLAGLPSKPIKVGDEFYVPGPIGTVKDAAAEYMRRSGLPYNPPRTYVKVDPARATRIADAFEQMKHAPDDPAVKASYDALAKEVLAQWQVVKETGLKIDWMKAGQPDPYAKSLRMTAMDVARNNHLWVFPTEQGFGSGDAASAAAHATNPMLHDTGEVVGGHKMLVNDVFRIVHDYFGHFKEGVGFRADGEDNAWRSHASMFSDAAMPALTSETRGQNSWVNYGPSAAHNKTASPGDTVYAPQKVGLMPDWTWKEGRADPQKAYARQGDSSGAFLAAIWRPTTAGRQQALLAGVTPVSFHELTGEAAGTYREIAWTAKAAGAEVEVLPADAYRALRLFTTPDRKAGFTLKAGNISHAFEHPRSEFRNFQTAAQALVWSLRADWDESKHPRVQSGPEHGQFTESGGGGGEAEAELKLDPKVIGVGGDDWNKRTAVKLEREYQAVKPKIEQLERKAIGVTDPHVMEDNWNSLEFEIQDAAKAEFVDQNSFSESADEVWDDMTAADKFKFTQDSTYLLDKLKPEPDDEEAPYIPEEWDTLSNDDQQEGQDEYVSQNFEAYHDSEIENWSQEYAPDEAKTKVAEDFFIGTDTVWAEDAIGEVLDAADAAGKPIPFDTKQLLDALIVKYEGNPGGYPKPDVEIEFDDNKLKEPKEYDPAQQMLPGIQKIEPYEMLTQDMRDNITKALEKAFDKRADSVASDLEPPEYLADNAKEFAGESWDNLPDKQKFSFIENYTSILEKYKIDFGAGVNVVGAENSTMKLDRLPSKYDPLNNTSGADYRRTQTLARILSRGRSKEILAERGLNVPDDNALRRIDNLLWRGWVGSSTSLEGMMLQLAAAEELGGRLNAKTRSTINPDELKPWADRQFTDIGGYAGVKALTRAKWETSQYLLDKAGLQELELYRGMTLDKTLVEKLFGPVTKHAQSGRKVQGYDYLPTMDVKRNGAASTSSSREIANNWGKGQEGKVTLRALVPRTAVLSVPAYGINEHSEQEVVITGTAWKGWDVWKGMAPGFTSTPLQA